MVQSAVSHQPPETTTGSHRWLPAVLTDCSLRVCASAYSQGTERFTPNSLLIAVANACAMSL